jgi:DNA polymerase III subunit delta'
MFFRDIVGQEDLKSRLINTVKENRVSHAWLFFGAEGTGALPIALAFAGYILCNGRTGSDACGTCISCNKVGKHIHPDLHFVYPVNKTKSVDKDNITSDDFIGDWRKFLLENPYRRLTQWFDYIDLDNKQGVINTDESKRLAGKLFLKSFESDYKIVIIWHPEKMNDQASNKLLKLLEEPPDMTLFLLVSENPDQLLATVRSRCIPVKVPAVKDEDIREVLVQKHGVSLEKAEDIVRLASGNYLKATELITESDDLQFNFIKFRDLMRSCFKGSIPELMKHADELATLNREKQKTFLEYCLRLIRESLMLHYDDPAMVFLAHDEKTFTPNFAPFIHGKNIVAFDEEINRAIQDIERNGNGRIIFLDLALTMTSLIRRKSR